MLKKNIIRNFLVWVILAVIFDLGLLYFKGSEKALEFAGGYIIELSLSVDNLFLFLIIFTSFKLTPVYQKRVLNYGIIGAVILRFLFIVSGIAIVEKFNWILYIFGFILIFSGIKIFLNKEKDEDMKDSRILKVFSKFIPVTEEMEGEKFFIRKNNILYATPLLAVLVLVECSDIIFAIDSIPAIFSVTTDIFIVFSSNLFAILGLRNLYFILEKLQDNFAFVKYGVAFILVFTGIKLAAVMFNIHISIVLSLLIILTILTVSVVASIIFSRKEKLFAEDI